MPLPRFRIRTLMIAVAVVGLVLWCLKNPAGFVATAVLSWVGAFRFCMKRFYGDGVKRPPAIDQFHAVVGSALFSLLPATAVPMLLGLAILVFALVWIVTFGK